MKFRYPLVGVAIALLLFGSVKLYWYSLGTPTALTVEPAKILGDPQAPNYIVVFSDFGCPFCMLIAPRLSQLVKDFPGQIKIIYKHFPLRSHPITVLYAAEASECAADQNKFWPYHDELFNHFEQWVTHPNVKPFLTTYAQNVGLDMKTFEACYDSGKKLEIVKENRQEGIGYRVSGTPTCILNGVKILRKQDLESLREAVREAIGRGGKTL